MNKMILVDIETQDFPVESGIYEVACLVVEDYKIVDQLYLGNKIKGYTGKLDYGNGFEDISSDEESINKFQTLLTKYSYPIVAHNCPFEKKFLKHYHWIDEKQKLYCSARAIRYKVQSLQSYSMDFLMKYFNVKQDKRHTAMGDVMALYELLERSQPILWLKIGEKLTQKMKSTL